MYRAKATLCEIPGLETQNLAKSAGTSEEW